MRPTRGASPTAGMPGSALPAGAGASYGATMRVESSVVALSWIPSEAVKGVTKLPFSMGVAHYDPPPPEVVRPDDLAGLREEGRFRFANEVRAWVEVEDGKITGWGQEGGGHLSSTIVGRGRAAVEFEPVALPDIRPEPTVSETEVRFVQTAGGRTGAPAPRTVRRKPFVQVSAPLAWSTLALTIRADGTSEFEVVGASPFPRHWIYDAEGKLAAKSGRIDFDKWYRYAFGSGTPWGDEDSPALVTAVETALERQLSATLMSGRKPRIKKVKEGKMLTEQGKPGDELFLLLDGVLTVEVDGEPLAELGPGALLGERAVLEGGTRTATLRAVTPCKVAVARGDELDPAALAEVSQGHRREEARKG
jgi:Cyclic nucleotide-binding domain